jgi:hypothetical protein
MKKKYEELFKKPDLKEAAKRTRNVTPIIREELVIDNELKEIAQEKNILFVHLVVKLTKEMKKILQVS